MCSLMLQLLFWRYDGKISNSIDSFKHRSNMVCVSLFYRYYTVFCSSKIRRLIPVHHVSPCNARLSSQNHSYVVDWPVNRKIPYGQNSFSSRTVRMWHFLRAKVVIFLPLRDENAIKYRKAAQQQNTIHHS